MIWIPSQCRARCEMGSYQRTWPSVTTSSPTAVCSRTTCCATSSSTARHSVSEISPALVLGVGAPVPLGVRGIADARVGARARQDQLHHASVSFSGMAFRPPNPSSRPCQNRIRFSPYRQHRLTSRPPHEAQEVHEPELEVLGDPAGGEELRQPSSKLAVRLLDPRPAGAPPLLPEPHAAGQHHLALGRLERGPEPRGLRVGVHHPAHEGLELGDEGLDRPDREVALRLFATMPCPTRGPASGGRVILWKRP